MTDSLCRKRKLADSFIPCVVAYPENVPFTLTSSFMTPAYKKPKRNLGASYANFHAMTDKEIDIAWPQKQQH